MTISPVLAWTALASLLLPAAAAGADSTFDYVSFSSPALDREMRVGVYLPAGYAESEQRYPALYFLHGLFGSERKWESRGMPEQLDTLIAGGSVEPMIVVCPNGENSMYVNWLSGKGRWEDFIASDLVGFIDGRYRTVGERRARGITGDSMGGYGALNLAFHHGDVFGSVSAHSAALYPVELDQLPDWVARQAERWKDVYGYPVDDEFWRANNPLHLAASADRATLARLAIYFDCGTEDRFGFAEPNAELSRLLTARTIPHEFHLRDGGHGREYYTAHAFHSLEFHDAAFRTIGTAASEEAEPAPASPAPESGRNGGGP